MRKLKLVVQTSLDGFGADSRGNTDWLVWNWTSQWTWDKALQKVHEKLISSADTVLHSRHMINGEYLGHWAEIASRHGSQQKFARNLLRMKNYAFSRHLKNNTNANATLVTGDLVSTVKRLKKKEGKDMLAFGGVSFVASLIKAKLVDDFYLFVNPTILGKGKNIYKSLTDIQTLKLKSSVGYKCGVVVLHYCKI